MASVKSIKRDIQALGALEQEQILNYLEEASILGSFVDEVTNEVRENRFSIGKVCPHCGHDEVSRNGKYNGKQRYICKSCRKTFTDFTRSPHYNSKRDIRKWIFYAKSMINEYSIRKCARIVGISIPTSFYWKHKILDAIRVYMRIGSIGGVIEVDEAFFREFLKATIEIALHLLCHVEPTKEMSKAAEVVQVKEEKEVFQRSRSAYIVLWTELETLLLNLYVKEE